MAYSTLINRERKEMTIQEILERTEQIQFDINANIKDQALNDRLNDLLTEAIELLETNK
tara:strand:- start:99 stop:275 length:177 start_codon:yes stop_codon:yes gene_type:complete